MKNYDDRGELASRDIVSRAIDNELKKSGDEYVYLDCRHMGMVEFEKLFPNIKHKCEEIGLDLTKDMIPVVPAAHYLCGGIDTDEHGQSTIQNLFACGECAHTGLHGANRLASNSLLEALVFAHRCFEKSVEIIDQKSIKNAIPEWNEEGTSRPKERILITHNKKELQRVMNSYVGIIRTDERLRRAFKRTKLLYEETEELYQRTKLSPQLFELRNMITIAYLIVNQSLARKENCGGFYKKK
jgi:L-aspartate oxidase